MIEKEEKTFIEKIQSISSDSVEGSLLIQIDSFLEKIKNKFPIKDEEVVLIDGELTGFIIDKKTIQDFIEKVNIYLFDLKENQKKDFFNMCRDFLSPIVKDTPKKEVIETVKSKEGAPSPLEALASIKDRLSQNTVIAPTKRDYSLEKPQGTPSTPIIDPYRELPEK